MKSGPEVTLETVFAYETGREDQKAEDEALLREAKQASERRLAQCCGLDSLRRCKECRENVALVAKLKARLERKS